MKHKKSFKTILSAIAFIILCVLGAFLFYFNSDRYHYSKAVKFMEEELYEEALLVLENISDYKDVPELIKESHYEIAYSAYQQSDYTKAAEFFEKAQDYKYAENFLNTCWYQLGHQAFLENDFETSRAYFSNIENILDFGAYHFETYDDAKEYIVTEALKAKGTIELYLADTGPESEYGIETKFTYLACAEQAYVNWNSSEKKVTINPVYYPGVKLTAYHRADNQSSLTQKETKLYEKALKIVEEAKSETSTEIELEAWLSSWLSRNIVYVSESSDNYSDFLLPREWTAFGAIIDGKANCQGFADAFYLLASLCGFNVRYQFGESEDAGHVWNAIELDGQWYYIDTTWNNMDHSVIDTTYAYFNYVEGDITNQKSYDFAKVVKTAPKTNESVDYYSANNSVFETLEKAVKYAVSQKLNHGEKTVYLRITTPFLSTNDFLSEIKRQCTNYGYSVTVLATTRKLDTCFTIHWNSLYR
ncbi:MAG: hypothetical protein E7192_04045 [Erysipelotrichaceae bacterium]|nr:hypothetical protein [Erysipelotrichaceae bacterium]